MFFAPPSVIETTIFARLPDALADAAPDNEWVTGQPIGMPARSMLEGPSFDRDGTIWCVDIVNGRILCVSREGAFRVAATYDGWPNGLKIHRDGRIFIADYKHGIMLLDAARGRVTPWLVRAGLERFKGVNDLFFAANGDLYFTDQGMTGLHDPSGRLFRVRANGEVTCLLDRVPSPNGLVMNLEETAIYLAVTRANAVWRVPLLRDGGVGKVGTFIQLSGGSGPDGLALDAEGRLLIAHFGMGCVWVMSASGEPVHRINSCASAHLTNLAFGGSDGRTLYITDSGAGAILSARLDVAGKTMFSHAANEPRA
jgi:gluconolactonase